MTKTTTVADVEEVLARARRLREGVRKFKGDGASWDYAFPDGVTEHYTVAGVMPFEQLKDDISSLFVWLWSSKDYLRLVAEARGRDPQIIERLVNRTPALCLLADAANKLKHGELLKHRRRTTYNPSLGVPEFTIRQHALRKLVFSADGVTVEPRDSSSVEVSYPVLDETGNFIADAIVLLQSGIGYWEKALSEL